MHVWIQFQPLLSRIRSSVSGCISGLVSLQSSSSLESGGVRTSKIKMPEDEPPLCFLNDVGIKVYFLGHLPRYVYRILRRTPDIYCMDL